MLLLFICSFSRYDCIFQFGNYIPKIASLFIKNILLELTQQAPQELIMAFIMMESCYHARFKNLISLLQAVFGLCLSQFYKFGIQISKVYYQKIQIQIVLYIKMSLQFCLDHNQLKDYICAKNQCNQLLCLECFKHHGQVARHIQTVKLSHQSKQFFLRWTKFMLDKLNYFSQIVTHMGYSKIFQMKLDLNHPKGTVSQLNFQQIQKKAMEALQEQKKLTEGNLTFINGTTTLTQMIHPQFLKDLYNIACQDARFNLQNIPNSIQRKLIEAYPTKQIYKFSKFHVYSKQIVQIEEERKKLVKQFEDKMIYRLQIKQSPIKSNSSLSSPNSKKQINKQEGATNDYNNLTEEQFSKEYQSSSQKSVHTPTKTEQELKRQKSGQNLLKGKSPKQYDERNDEYIGSKTTVQSLKQNSKITNEANRFEKQRLQTTISFLKSNEEMYKSKCENIELQNKKLTQQLQGLSRVSVLNRELQEEVNKLPSLKQKATKLQQLQIQLKRNHQVQAQHVSQISQLQALYQQLTQQNRDLNAQLKEKTEIVQNQFIKINKLQEEVKGRQQYENYFKRQEQLKRKEVSEKLSAKSIELTQAIIKNQQLQQLVKKLQEWQNLCQEVENLKTKNQELESLKNGNQTKSQQLVNDINTKQQAIQFLQKQLEAVKQSLSDQYSQQATNIKTHQQVQQALKQQVKKLTESEDSLKEQIVKIQQQSKQGQQQMKVKMVKLQQKVQLKQKSIKQLNQLISNEEEEISYRQNQVQILEEQVKKLISKIKFLQQSIHQLNKLISNQEEEISYRENQVDSLGEQISKLLKRIKDLQTSIKSLNSLIANEEEEITYRQNESEILEQEVKKLLEKNVDLEKSIHELNNLISNEEEEIAYRENESETLEEEVKKLIQKNKFLEKSIHELNNLIANEQQQIAYRQNQSETLTEQVKKLIEKTKSLQQAIQGLNAILPSSEREALPSDNVLESVTLKIKELVKNSQSLRNQVKTAKTQLQNVKASLQTELKNVKEQLSLTKSDLSNRGQTQDLKASQIVRLQEQLKQVKNKIEEQKRELSSQVSKVNQELEKIRENSKKQVEKATQQLTQRKSQSDKQVQNVKQQLVKQTQQLQKQIDQAKQQLSKTVEASQLQIQKEKYQAHEAKEKAQKQVQLFQAQLQQIRRQLQQTKKSFKQVTVQQQLLEQVVLLEADLQCKVEDIQILTALVQQYIRIISEQSELKAKEQSNIVSKLKKLKSVDVDMSLLC